MIGHIPYDALVPLYHGAEVGGLPVEHIPDGSIWYPHHFWTGLLVAALGVYAHRSDGRAVTTVAGMAVAAYGWLFLWQNGVGPFWGAMFSVAGVTVATGAVVAGSYWRHNSLRAYPRLLRVDLRRAWRADARSVLRAVGGNVAWTLTHPRTAFGRAVTPRTVTFVGLLIAADDAIDHTFPVTTPLQWFWATHGHAISDAVSQAIAMVV